MPVQVFAPEYRSITNVGIDERAGVYVSVVPVEDGQVVLVAVRVPPLIVGGVIVCDMPRVLATVHSVNASTKYFLPADTAASSVTPWKFGRAITMSVASTAITTTSSISENPFSPGFRLRTRLVLGLRR